MTLEGSTNARRAGISPPFWSVVHRFFMVLVFHSLGPLVKSSRTSTDARSFRFARKLCQVRARQEGVGALAEPAAAWGLPALTICVSRISATKTPVMAPFKVKDNLLQNGIDSGKVIARIDIENLDSTAIGSVLFVRPPNVGMSPSRRRDGGITPRYSGRAAATLCGADSGEVGNAGMR